MPYCVNCGVELSDYLEKCPLCGTEALPPGKPAACDCPPFPQHTPREQSMQKNGVIFILSLLLLIPAALTLLCDIGLNRSVTWSSYVIGACAMLYLILIPPIRLPRRSPVWMIALDAAGISAYLYLIEREAGGEWFFHLGLPVVLGLAVVIIMLLTLLLHTKAPRLNIIAGALVAVGLYAVWIEYLVNTAFQLRKTFVWSFYPLVTFLILSAVLVVIQYNKPLKEKLKRKFFL